MTQESPIREPSSPAFCADCRTAVRLERTSKTLLLRCACGTAVDVQLDDALPLPWEEGTGYP